MRILQICNRVPWPAKDGGAIAMLNMSKAFHSLGHEMHMLCLNTRKHYADVEALPDFFRQIASFQAVDINTNEKPSAALFNLLFSRQSYNVTRFYSSNFEKILIETLHAYQFDIIQIEGLHMCVYLQAIRRHSTCKIALRAHNLEHQIWERLAETELNAAKRKYLEILAKRLLNFEIKAAKEVDVLVAITEEDAVAFRDIRDDKPVFVSPAGLNFDDYVINRSKKEWPGIFHLGALNWMPNIQAIEWFLKEIWPNIHKQYPKMKFYVAGRNMPAWLSQLSGVGVVAVGEVDSAVDFMNNKSILVVPLLSGSGMRIKIIEGMALGKTIISTSVGAEGIDYEDGKNILIADEPEDFVNALKKCLNNPEFATRIGHNARQLAEQQYDSKTLAARLVGFYERL